MHPVIQIKREHVIIKRKLLEIEQELSSPPIDRKKLAELLFNLESFWSQHEEKEEKFFEWFQDRGGIFPYRKIIISEHNELKGHWKVLNTFLKFRSDLELQVALDTDGRMTFDKLRKHITTEDKYFDKYFRKF